MDKQKNELAGCPFCGDGKSPRNIEALRDQLELYKSEIHDLLNRLDENNVNAPLITRAIKFTNQIDIIEKQIVTTSFDAFIDSTVQLIYMMEDYKELSLAHMAQKNTIEATLVRKKQGKKTKQIVFKEIDKRLNKGLNKRQIAEEIAAKTGFSVSHIRNQIFPLYEGWPTKS